MQSGNTFDIIQFYQLINAQNYEELTKFISSDCRLEIPGELKQNEFVGTEQLIGCYKWIQSLSDNTLQFLPRYVCKDKEQIALQWYSHARLPSGLNYMNRGVTFIKIQNNLASEIIWILDTEIQTAAYLQKDLDKANKFIHRLYSYAWEPARKIYEENAKLLNQVIPEIQIQSSERPNAVFQNNIEPLRITSSEGIREYYRAFSKGDFDTMLRMTHAQAILEFPGTLGPVNIITGGENVIAFLKNIVASTNNSLRFHQKQALYDGNHAIVHWFTTAFIPTGGNYINRGCAWFTLEDGLCTALLDFLDTDLISAFYNSTEFTRAKTLGELIRKQAPQEAAEIYDKNK